MHAEKMQFQSTICKSVIENTAKRATIKAMADFSQKKGRQTLQNGVFKER